MVFSSLCSMAGAPARQCHSSGGRNTPTVTQAALGEENWELIPPGGAHPEGMDDAAIEFDGVEGEAGGGDLGRDGGTWDMLSVLGGESLTSQGSRGASKGDWSVGRGGIGQEGGELGVLT